MITCGRSSKSGFLARPEEEIRIMYNAPMYAELSPLSGVVSDFGY